MVDPIRRCKPAEDGSITVCGTDTERHRLTPELRAIAGVGREAPPKLPRAEAKAMSLDRLPYNWISIGGRYPPGPEYNALFEMVKERTDPETGAPAVAEEAAAAAPYSARNGLCRSEERRVGKEWVRSCRSRWLRYY